MTARAEHMIACGTSVYEQHERRGASYPGTLPRQAFLALYAARFAAKRGFFCGKKRCLSPQKAVPSAT